MPIYESSKDYGTGVVMILWDGDKPSDEEFLDHARNEYGTDGTLAIDFPTEFRGMTNPGTATVTPNVINGGQMDRLEIFRAEMIDAQIRMAKLSANFLKLDDFENAARCAIKADGLKWVIGRIPPSAIVTPNDLGNRRAAFGASALTDGLAGKRTE